MGNSKTKKPTITPVITGIRPQGERKIIALHFHPDQIKQYLAELKEEAASEGKKAGVENPLLVNLFTDIEVLTHWALARLPLVPPPDKKPASEGKES